ncbi:syntaxin-31-like isoform X1 [Chenopodium quinoa]|uniref:syntaxin-31-like isoform X1 n=1 Tax=Chenopodium quinoa TaxID=63459 RepID=UPI000B7912A0|nr:syntaxin-31-like isoform X1 [Chenopodium quinoa]
MASIRITSYRDRTAEFRSLSETLMKIEGISAAVNSAGIHPTTANQSAEQTPSSSTRSEFNTKASRIGLGIHEASRKIARLSQMAKTSSMFNDPTKEIQELTALIKDDITALNVAVADLQNLQNSETTKSYSDDKAIHANAVCDDIKNRLMAATKQFQEVLTTRTENIKAHETRKQLFSANASRDNPFQRSAKAINEPPPWSNSSNVSASVQPTLRQSSSGAQSGSQLRRRMGTETIPSNNMEMSMLQQAAPQQENHYRATALQNVESTISELSGIFTHLATTVAHQGELLIRIDDNMEESLSNVEGAHSALLKHLTRISSNRSLLFKLFGVLIFFLVVFIFFIV